MGSEVLSVVIRADAGPGVGTGHVMRMLALGQACVRLGGSVTMAVGDLPVGLVRRIEDCRINVRRLANHSACLEDAAETSELAKELNADWLVVDGYAFGSDYQCQLGTSPSLMVMDDGNVGEDSPAELVLNQNAFAKVPSSRSPANFLRQLASQNTSSNRLVGCWLLLVARTSRIGQLRHSKPLPWPETNAPSSTPSWVLRIRRSRP